MLLEHPRPSAPPYRGAVGLCYDVFVKKLKPERQLYHRANLIARRPLHLIAPDAAFAPAICLNGLVGLQGLGLDGGLNIFSSTWSLNIYLGKELEAWVNGAGAGCSRHRQVVCFGSLSQLPGIKSILSGAYSIIDGITTIPGFHFIPFFNAKPVMRTPTLF